ncbi:HTTM domain-containing protein [Gemmatimonas sp.]
MNDGAAFDDAVRLVQCLAAVAMLVVGLEWRALQRRGTLNAVWAVDALREQWGWRRMLMAPRITRGIPLMQLLLAAVLLLTALFDWRPSLVGAAAAGGLAATLWHTAVRVRSTMNGGSDGMLFIVLLALAVATAPVSQALRYGALLFVAAQLVMSYLRAGWVKARERDWWTGAALHSFLAIPAYGVPRWLPQSPMLLRAVSCGVMLFELAAPLALVSPAAAVAYTAVAWCFHFATAAIFGLNRFLLAWSAALPSLWFAAHMLQAGRR